MPFLEATSTGAIIGASTEVWAIALAAGSTNATATIDDSLTGAGTSKWTIHAMANDSREIAFSPPHSLVFNSGVYLTLSGTGAKFCVQYGVN